MYTRFTQYNRTYKYRIPIANTYTEFMFAYIVTEFIKTTITERNCVTY